MEKLSDKIALADKTYSLFNKSEKILVGLSGGADSVSLLLSLKENYPQFELYACHVNHMLRGKDADNDCDFCKYLCDKMNIPFFYVQEDVARIALEQGISTELAARNVRYAYFEKMCSEHGINTVALAHTLSDNAETVLFNLTRGTALSGLCGIPPKRMLSDDIQIIRPLILATREDVESYLESKKQSYVTDSSNLTDDYTRNYFRHNIIPLLKNVNPSFEENLGKTCISLRENDNYIKAQSATSSTNSIFELGNLDICILKEVIAEQYKKFTGKTDIENVHICKIAELIRLACENKGKNFEVCLPGKTSAVIKDGIIYFTETITDKEVHKDYYHELVTGLNIIYDTDFAVFISEEDSCPEDFPGYSVIDYADIRTNADPIKLVARSRQNGDTIKHNGMTKKLKSIFNHKKIPTEARCSLPIICTDKDILYIPLAAVSDICKKGVRRIRIFIYSRTPQLFQSEQEIN